MANKFSLKNHRLAGAEFVESPNKSQRPEGTLVDLLIIHNISLPPGEYGTGCVTKLFCNVLDSSQHPYFVQLENLKVSSHLLIDRNGLVTQFVGFNEKAWHAGESIFNGKDNCNENSIGIELEGSDFEDFTKVQYEVLVEVTQLLLTEYPCLNLDRIVGHSDVAPGRKTDPGPCFDWKRYKNAL